MNKIKNFLTKPFKWFFKTRRRNKVITIIGIVILLIVLIIQVQIANAKPQYIFQKVTREDIIGLVSETGNVATTNRTDIYSPTNGIIEELYVENDDIVAAGQQLFKVRSTATEQEKTQALAAYLTAKNTLDTANSNLYALQSTMFSQWDTFKNLAEGDTYENSDGSPKYNQRSAAEFHIAEKDWLSAEANYKKQQAVISQAQAALASASLAYEATQDTVVKSTSRGIVANLLASLNNSVTVKSTTSLTPVLIIIADNGGTNVSLSLNEVDIPKVKNGQKAEIVFDALPGKTFKGVVKNTDTVGTNTQGVITYGILISITNPDAEIKPGMTADVEIEVAKAEGVLTVPNTAVKPYQGKKAVQTLDPKTKKLKFIPVETGIKGIDKTEIKSGISENSQVISGIKNGSVSRTSTGFGQ